MSGDAKRSKSKRLMVGIIILAAVPALLFIPLIPVDSTYDSVEPYYRPATYQTSSAKSFLDFDQVRGAYETTFN